MIRKFDFLVIGSGVAGMKLRPESGRCGQRQRWPSYVKPIGRGPSTAKAQRGIASVTNLKVDNFEKHIKGHHGCRGFHQQPCSRGTSSEKTHRKAYATS